MLVYVLCKCKCFVNFVYVVLVLLLVFPFDKSYLYAELDFLFYVFLLLLLPLFSFKISFTPDAPAYFGLRSFYSLFPSVLVQARAMHARVPLTIELVFGREYSSREPLHACLCHIYSPFGLVHLNMPNPL